MKFKIFEEATLTALESAVNVWLLTGTYFCYSNCYNMVPDGGGGENYCMMIFYMEK